MERKKYTFPKSFFSQPMPHATRKTNLKDKPFKWSESVLNEETKVKIVSNKPQG